MTPKERVIAVLNHEEPDCVPTGENAVNGALIEEMLGRPTLYSAGWHELEALWDGRRAEVAMDYGKTHVELVRQLEWDYVRVPVVPADKEYRRPRMTGPHSWVDDEGNEVCFNPDVGSITERIGAEGMTIDELPNPAEPFEVDPSQLEAIRYVVKELGETHFIIGRTPLDGSFPFKETVGAAELLIRMVTEPEFVLRARDAYVKRSIAYAEAMLDVGCDAVMTCDDYSDNRAPMMGPERFREFILPAIILQSQAIHAKGGYFIKHTDGNTWSILDSLIEAKIDGWHGIQTSIGMDMALLKARYGDRLCFFGGVNCETLVDATPEDARAEVRHAIKHAAPGGGLVLTTGNVLQPGTQLKNYLAARQATRDYGRYPIDSNKS